MEFLQDIWNQHFFSKLSGGPYRLEFDTSNIKALQVDRESNLTNAKILFDMGVPFNEIDKSESLGIGDIPGGDVGYLPLNLIPTTGEVEEVEEEQKSIEYKEVKQDSKNDRIWKTFIVKQTSIEKLLKKEIKSYFHKQRKKTLANLARMFKNGKTKTIDDDLIDTYPEISLLKSILFPIYIIAEEAGADMIAEELGVEGFIFDPLDESFLGPMELRLRNVAPALVETVKDAIRVSLTEGISSGEGVGELSDRVRKVYNEAGNRATTIARTESATAINRGRHEMMNKQGIKKTEWLTAMDGEVRDSHRALNRSVADLGAVFRYVLSFPDSGIISGGYSQLRFPNDPQAPAAEVINCRCITLPLIER
jgi:SPP1 gp7 family putative phage head morphogenesis protein